MNNYTSRMPVYKSIEETKDIIRGKRYDKLEKFLSDKGEYKIPNTLLRRQFN